MQNRDEYEKKTKALNLVQQLLKEKGQPLHYTVLMDEVAGRFFGDEEDLIRAKARFYTWLNLDTRFSNVGQGYWGLRNWAPAKGARRLPLLSLMHKTVEYDDSTPKTAREGTDDEFYPPEEETIADEEPVSEPDDFPGEEGE